MTLNASQLLKSGGLQDLSMRLAWKKHLSKKCLRHPDASNARLKLTWNQSFRGVRLSARASYMQI